LRLAGNARHSLLNGSGAMLMSEMDRYQPSVRVRGRIGP